ncbi:MAG TPA: DinB family protein [Symbiobacteriaceae bacterium]|nr:DinB family protein [Symbiobacteriaceae bacterium]
MANFYVDQFLRHRKATLQFANVMPAEQWNFKPYEGALSFGQLVAHIVGAAEWFLGHFDGVAFDRATVPQDREGILAFIEQKTAEQVARIEKAAAEPERLVDFRGNPMTVNAMMANLREHEVHHKGQLMTYLRMAGVTDKLFYTV